ncbi:MAG TPA: metalloregulator ArsR/SmtB family transcription factor [Patescibacteria group bacterium]|nr:metalloregulator ArsR/SmtB family transcription factor [Patescibacteria group bacterium]
MDLKLDCAACFTGLSSKIRIQIVNLLKKKKKMSVLTIAENFNLTQPTISHHLKYLKNCGILATERKGKKIYYFISPRCKVEGCKVLEKDNFIDNA